MSEYVNGYNINIVDIVRIKFLDDKAQGVSPELIAEIAMQYLTFKMLHEGMGKVIEAHEAKLRQESEAIAKAN
jgi:hypothetical protein